jgi:hypothetical protein
MAWFTFLQASQDATPATIQTPLRRELIIDNIEDPFNEGDILSVKLNGKKINKKLDGTLTEITDTNSYLVVYEDFTNDSFFEPVESLIVDDVLYFKAYEDGGPDIFSTKKYSIYYGLNNINNLEYLGDGIYQQVIEEDFGTGILPVPEEGEGEAEPEPELGVSYILSEEDIELGLFNATEDSPKSYQLALYDKGVSWVNNKSQKIGAKAFGVFDGPKLYIYGDKGPDFGKFRIRITKVDSDNNFVNTIALDWQTVDCFARDLNEQIIFESTEELGYERYLFEIETILEKNPSSTSNSVVIRSYEFIPNYKIEITNEQINPLVAFIRIGGIK